MGGRDGGAVAGGAGVVFRDEAGRTRAPRRARANSSSSSIERASVARDTAKRIDILSVGLLPRRRRGRTIALPASRSEKFDVRRSQTSREIARGSFDPALAAPTDLL